MPCAHDFTAISTELGLLKQAVIDLRGRINTELIPKAQEVLTELTDLDDNFVGVIATNVSGAGTVIDSDTTTLAADLAALETSMTAIKGVMDAVLVKYSDAFSTAAQEVIDIYDIQEEIKTYLIQAKNIINT